ncbi:MAG: hypothetical protein K2K59_07620, partial [Muribaculaceae bacterium]|nr:hypothetical protein [Muribaculaceae bacterium]
YAQLTKRYVGVTPDDAVIKTPVQTLTINGQTTTTTIEEVTSDEQTTFIDLQGRRVSKPTHGIYLRTQAGKTTKIKL